jgi:hypothetical protein
MKIEVTISRTVSVRARVRVACASRTRTRTLTCRFLARFSIFLRFEKTKLYHFIKRECVNRSYSVVLTLFVWVCTHLCCAPHTTYVYCRVYSYTPYRLNFQYFYDLKTGKLIICIYASLQPGPAMSFSPSLSGWVVTCGSRNTTHTYHGFTDCKKCIPK